MISERLKEIRTYFDNTQQELADYLRVSRSTYAGWENNIDSIPLLKLNDFCNYYNISLDYICELSNNKNCGIIKRNIDKKVLGNNLKTIRIKNDDTQTKVADKIKIDQSTYSRCETGKSLIYTYPLIEFAKYYNVSIDWLIGKTNNPKISK